MPYSFNPLSGLGLDQSIPLDGAGKIPSDYLPSYVDDVVEYANLAGFPATGETGKIYVAIDTGFTYRWSGSVYIQINSLTGTFAADAGTAAAPSISIGTADNGLYAPAEDQVAISSSGTQRVNFGTGEVVFNETGENYDFRIEGDTEPNLVFVDASANRVGLGTSSPLGRLHVDNGSSDHFMYFQARGANGLESSAVFLTKTSAGVSTGGSIGHDGSTNTLYLTGATSGGVTQHVSIDSSGNVGIGTTSPSEQLEIYSTSDHRLKVSRATTAIELFQPASASPMLNASGTGVTLRFGINDTEAARIDNSGRLLVGTSTADGAALLQVDSAIESDRNKARGFGLNLATTDELVINVTTGTFDSAVVMFNANFGSSSETTRRGFSVPVFIAYSATPTVGTALISSNYNVTTSGVSVVRLTATTYEFIIKHQGSFTYSSVYSNFTLDSTSPVTITSITSRTKT
jgi:hypothetical protein